MSDVLPAVLTPTDGSSAISIERALNQIKRLLEHTPSDDESHEDAIMASLDDVDVMLKAICR